MAGGALDRVYQELVSEIELLRPSCRSRALLPLADLVAFLQRLSVCRPQDLVLAVVEAPELHCFLALQDIPKGNAVQGTSGLNKVQLQVIELLCDSSVEIQAPPVAACRKALRTIFQHYDSNEVSVHSTVKLLSECARKGWWDIAKLIVGRLSAHMKVADLGVVEQKVLGTLRDSLVQYGACCLGVLLEPLHKLIFVHFNTLMAQGTAPEADNLPPAIKWYMRLLRKCAGKVVGNGSQTATSVIKQSDIDFLFWPFIISLSEIRASFTSKEAKDWSSRYDLKIKTWRGTVIEQLRTDLKMPKATGLQVMNEEPCYNWLPFAEYALSPDLWIWLHDLLSHCKGSVEDIESRHKRFLETSATGARTLGMGAALVEILAQELWTCNKYHVLENSQLAESNGRPSDHTAECCGCIHQDAKSAGTYTVVAVTLLVPGYHDFERGNAAALLIWLLRPDLTELCESSWAIIINNLLLATLTIRKEFAIQYYDPSGKHLSDRIVPGLSHEDKIPFQATDSTLITLLENEKDFVLNKWSKGANQLRAQAWKLAERSTLRLEEVVWPALLSQMSCCSYSFTYHRILESLQTFAPRYSEKVDDPFPLLQLHVDKFLGVVKRAPQIILPLMRFLKTGIKRTAIRCFKTGESEAYLNQDSAQLNLYTLQEEEFVAAIHHCVLQEPESWAQKQDVLIMEVAAFSGGSFRYLFGELQDSVETIEINTMQKSGTHSNSILFGDLFVRENGGSRTAGLVAAVEGRRLLAWELRKWTETLQAIPHFVAKEHFPKLEALKRIYFWASALRNEFPLVDRWVAGGLSTLGRFLHAQEEDVLWEREVQAENGARSAKRPRLSSDTTTVPFSKILETEREWIVEALCRSPIVEKYLLIYLGHNDKKGPKNSQAIGRKQKKRSDTKCLHQQSLVSYLAKHPCKIPILASLCCNQEVLQVSCKALQEASTNVSSADGSDIFELWFQFVEKFREAGCNLRSLKFLPVGSRLARLTECALHHTTVISNWPQNLLESLVSESPAMVRCIFEEARGYIESRLAANDEAACEDSKVGSVDFVFSGALVAMDQNPKAVAQYLESTLVAIYSNEQKASQSQQSRSSLLDLLSIVFALCRPESRTVVLSCLQESDFYKKSTIEGFDEQKDQPVLLGQVFILAVVFWRSKVLKDLKNIYIKHRATNRSPDLDVIETEQILSLPEQRAAVCHILLTSEPQLSSVLGGDQRAPTYGQTSSVSGEEMIFQLQAFAPIEEYPRLCYAINSWILLYCRMNIRLNLENIRALCRLHPCMVRDALIQRIEAELVEACKVEGSLNWRSSLEELKEGLVLGLLSWLPLDARSHFTATVGVPSAFWLESNTKGIYEVISCLRSSDVGVRRSAYNLVVAHQHHHHFVSSLTLELCKKAISSELTAEQEALLGLLIPVLMSDPRTASTIVESIITLFRKAMEVVLSPVVAGDENATSSSREPQQRHVKALLRVGLLACQVYPTSFATEEIALLLATLAKGEDPSEEIPVCAVQCLQVLALELRVTTQLVKLVQDLLLHLVYKPAGDYIWHLAITFAERFSLKLETKLGVEKILTTEVSFSMQELLYRCPLQRSIPLQAILKRLGSIDSH